MQLITKPKAFILPDLRLVTAEILYRMPDHQSLVQTYVWQKEDLYPKFPKLEEFLDFWDRELDGPIKDVRVVSAKLIGEADRLRAARGEFRLH